MFDHYYNLVLYPLQDQALSVVGALKTRFYLTGGTTLSRFLLNHRFSDDLDFFVNHDREFQNEVDHIYAALLKTFKQCEIAVRQDSFIRILIKEGEAILKIEFVNDVAYYVEAPVLLDNGLRLDNWRNILVNKITALQRLAGKDYVDVLYLSMNYSFNWEQIINEAKKKDAWINEISVSKYLSDFNLNLLDAVRFPASFNLSSIKQDYFYNLAKDSLQGFDNSLVNKKL